MEGVMAVVTMVAYDFAPKNWAYCNGQLLAIAQNQPLFSLLGTTYGGNGVSNFALPNMQSRVGVGVGQGSGLSNYTLGELTGTESCTLNQNHLPPHTHNGNVTVIPKAGYSMDELGPAANFPGQIANGYAATGTANIALGTPNVISVTVGSAGSSQPFSLETPYLAVNFIICMYGIYPSRN